jgi:hypothetical protein
MGYLDFHNKLNSLEDKEYIETFLVYNVSLIIAGVKPAVTITLKKNKHKLYNSWKSFGHSFIKDINLNYIELRNDSTALIIMIYEESLLEKYLNYEQNQDFLINLGYSKNSSIDTYVNTLKSRYAQYHCPHELGLFLGIPIKDVKDFMECEPKKCLLCGYWKVYNDSNRAKIIFNNYDKIKEYTIKTMLKGNSSHDLALSIKSSFNKKAQYI